MITRLVKMHFKTECVDEFKNMYEEVKSKILNFEGCSHLELLQDVNSPFIIFTYSIWDGEDALSNYRDSDLFKKTWAKTKLFFDHKPEAWSTERVLFPTKENIDE